MTDGKDGDNPAGPEPSLSARRDERTSELLGRLAAALDKPETTIGQVAYLLRRRSFGGILFLLAILGLLPGISTFAGLAMLIPAWQMTLGFRSPVLPRVIRRRRLQTATVVAAADRLVPILRRVERYVRPRWLVLTGAPVMVLIGITAGLLGLVVALPLPFSNLPPAVALVALAVGLFEKDGMLIAVGFAVALLAIALGMVMLVLAILAAQAIPFQGAS